MLGCTQSRHLHIHHIKHWADGGSTSVENGACFCSHLYTRKGDHTLVHEGGYTIQRIDNYDQRLKEQFDRQRRANDSRMFDFESVLRSSKDSFNAVRKLSTAHFRFRIIDAQGKNILDKPNASFENTEMWPTHRSHHSTQTTQAYDSTRVYCGEPVPAYHHIENTTNVQLSTL